jgi:ATP-dependent DNA helicase 2 subunit 2
MISDRKVDRVQDALKQMQAIVDRFVRCSLNGDLYEKAYECLKAIRAACVTEDEAPVFNKFANRIKDSFGIGPHKDFFGMLIKDKLTLITAVESEISSMVTEQEALEFLKPKSQQIE